MCKKCNRTPCCCPRKVSVLGRQGPRGPKGDPYHLIASSGLSDEFIDMPGPSGPTDFGVLTSVLPIGTYMVWASANVNIGGPNARGYFQLYHGATPNKYKSSFGYSVSAPSVGEITIPIITQVTITTPEALSIKAVNTGTDHYLIRDLCLSYLKIV